MRPRDNRGRFSKPQKSSPKDQMSGEKRPRSSDGGQNASLLGSPSISPASKKSLAEDIAAWGSSPEIQNDFYPQYMRQVHTPVRDSQRNLLSSPSRSSQKEANNNNTLIEKRGNASEPLPKSTHPVICHDREKGATIQSESVSNNHKVDNAQNRDLASQEHSGAAGGKDNTHAPPDTNNYQLAPFQSQAGQKNVIVLSNSEGLPISTVDLEGVMSRVMANVMVKLDSMSTDLKQVPVIKAATAKLDREVIQIRQDCHGIKHSVQELRKKEEDNSSKQDALEKEINDIKSRLQQRPSAKGEEENSVHPPTEMDNLIKEASARRINLIVEGIEELKDDEGVTTAVSQIKSFFSKTLHLPNFEIATAFRLGKPRQLALRPRPIKVQFLLPQDRDSVWRAKAVLARNRDFQYSIKEDLPPQLRAQMSALIKVSQIARRFPDQYKNVWIKDFQIHINGASYTADQLESLPSKLRPSVSSTPGNINVVVFYGRDSKFSNHFLCKFTWDNHDFSSMEQYLAYRRANIANNADLARQVMGSQDPVDAKRIMNTLKSSDTEPQWIEQRRDILFSGLMAKFSQNDYLMRYLLASGSRQLGEASLDKAWGIGMSLTDRLVLDPTKWVGSNLLGVTLMEVREELNSWIQQDKSQS